MFQYQRTSGTRRVLLNFTHSRVTSPKHSLLSVPVSTRLEKGVNASSLCVRKDKWCSNPAQAEPQISHLPGKPYYRESDEGDKSLGWERSKNRFKEKNSGSGPKSHFRPGHVPARQSPRFPIRRARAPAFPVPSSGLGLGLRQALPPALCRWAERPRCPPCPPRRTLPGLQFLS